MERGVYSKRLISGRGFLMSLMREKTSSVAASRNKINHPGLSRQHYPEHGDS